MRRARRQRLQLPARRWLLLDGQLVLNPSLAGVELHVVALEPDTRRLLDSGICTRGHTIAGAEDIELVPNVQWDRPPRPMCRRCAAELNAERLGVRGGR